jgi:hypothetical protein
MLYEDGFIYDDVGVSRDTLSMEQQFELRMFSQSVENMSSSQLKSKMGDWVRAITIQISISRNLNRDRLFDQSQPLSFGLSFDREVEVRSTIEELEEIEDIERLKQYCLTLLMVSFRVKELLKTLRD